MRLEPLVSFSFLLFFPSNDYLQLDKQKLVSYRAREVQQWQREWPPPPRQDQGSNGNESSSQAAPQRQERGTKEETGGGTGRRHLSVSLGYVLSFSLFYYSTNDYLPIDYMCGNRTKVETRAAARRRYNDGNGGTKEETSGDSTLCWSLFYFIK
jgi:hypothetical protein